ncbi:hypothetical protein JCM17823_12540 [Halorubrum gandharaense]
MERTPDGTPVGVDDPYAVAGVCDHLTDDGRCRYALNHTGNDAAFAAERRADGYACHVGADGEWHACPHYRSTTDGKECVRCGLGEVRMAHDDARPLLEEHHLSYGDASREPIVGEHEDEAGAGPHEITVSLCRWCHSKVHNSFGRIDDDASPDPEAVAEREGRRTKELEESAFESASERFGRGRDP